MADYRDQFEQRASRGTPRGANAVFDTNAPSGLGATGRTNVTPGLIRPAVVVVVALFIAGAAFVVSNQGDADEGVLLAQSEEPFFADVPESAPFFADIQWLGTQGISVGSPQPAGRPFFNPTNSLERQAVAAFLYRRAGSPPVGDEEPVFADVVTGHQFYDAIQWMGMNRLATGTPQVDGRPLFLPYDLVTREAMAAFVHRSAGSPAPGGVAPFSDVPVDVPFHGAIAWIGSNRIATGGPAPEPGSDPVFGPNSTLTRQAAAAFLHRYEDFLSLAGCVPASVPADGDC